MLRSNSDANLAATGASKLGNKLEATLRSQASLKSLKRHDVSGVTGITGMSIMKDVIANAQAEALHSGRRKIVITPTSGGEDNKPTITAG